MMYYIILFILSQNIILSGTPPVTASLKLLKYINYLLSCKVLFYGLHLASREIVFKNSKTMYENPARQKLTLTNH